jgi:transketolase
MYCLKPIDEAAILRAAKIGKIITIEEHGPFGGLGSIICQISATKQQSRVFCFYLPDTAVIAGKSPDVFNHYGLNAEGIVKKALEMI